MRPTVQLVSISLLSGLICLAESSLKSYDTTSEYNKNEAPPEKPTDVFISLFINRVSAVDENKEEISLDVFMYVYWKDRRVFLTNQTKGDHVEITWDDGKAFWIPDLYIRQLREMKILSLFQEMTSIRLYRNNTLRVSMGATVIIKCDMDFVLYPLDVQKCAVDFSSYKYTMNDMRFNWWTYTSGIMIPSDFGDGYRLPKYVVQFEKKNKSHVLEYGEGNHSTARMYIIMRRELRSYLLETYLPSSLFVIMSWGSFVVIPDMVPGRMVLLVTTLLSLVTMFDTVRNNSPSALELKCIEVWLISCTLFVFFALLEYFIVLFGIRYDKFWRHKKRDLDRINATSLDRPNENSQPTTLAAVAAAAAAAAVASNNVATATPAATNNHHRPAQLPPILHHRVGTNRVDNLRLFGGNSKIVPEEGSQHLQTKEVAPPRATVIGDGTSGEGTEPPARKKFRMVAEYVVLYCGSQRGTVDQVSLVLFPICFILFALVYWISYISSASKHDHV